MKTVLLLLVILLICDYPDIISVNAQQTAEPWDARSSSQDAEREMKDDEAMASTEMQGSVTGRVVGVNTALRTLTVKDESFDDNIDTYYINRDTAFTMASSLNDIKPGDIVSIDYFVINYKNIADSILVEEGGHSEESEAAISKVLVD